ncbi:uncharacterized protein B0H18DRAFT_536692 [Fomitopsis serialis]|uniref:uncharacterized protein n=1 Tax=Fomitopsis serialis TaxID=139415 RepID=UPI002008E220|nr:uncharacterized protein B0H18DRAFT_536692 [Neoantrodia serialis]KAH9921757.1 hypothetical protein B0H18DRAFT_536692 [Neoantrodia serialis]
MKSPVSAECEDDLPSVDRDSASVNSASRSEAGDARSRLKIAGLETVRPPQTIPELWCIQT